jgi:hypothetical protein
MNYNNNLALSFYTKENWNIKSQKKNEWMDSFE